jgi:hypothetical protein
MLSMNTGKSSYYVRIKPQLNVTNAVHKEDCPFLPTTENRIYLGEYSSFPEALRVAKLYFSGASACNFCGKECLDIKMKCNHDLFKGRPRMLNPGLADCN